MTTADMRSPQESGPRETASTLPRWLLATLLATPLWAVPAAAQTTWYVDGDATAGADDGTSWSDAYLLLQDALAVAADGDFVRVAEGTYVPTTGSDRGASFEVAEGVTLRGAYAGLGAPNPDARSTTLYPTVLSGDLLGDDGPAFANRGDNTYRLLVMENIEEPVVIDGVTLRAGEANGPGSDSEGAAVSAGSVEPLSLVDCILEDNRGTGQAGVINVGVSGTFNLSRCEVRGNSALGVVHAEVAFDDCVFQDNDPGFLVVIGIGLISDCRFENNAGGALVVLADDPLAMTSDPSITLRRCEFAGNDSSLNAGGVSVAGSAHITGCRFTGNASTAGFGAGGLYAVPGSPFLDPPSLSVENCEFSGNSSDDLGGGIYVDYTGAPAGTADIFNCSFSANSAQVSGGLYAEGGTSRVRNSIFWGNTATGSPLPPFDEVAVEGFDVDFSCIKGLNGVYPGLGNIGTNPLFADADGADNITGTDDDDLRLAAGSPCIDAGTNLLPSDTHDLDCDGDLIELLPFDLATLLRRFDDLATVDTGAGFAPVVDMGAHEFGSPLPVQQWADVGNGLTGTHGTPVLTGAGPLCANTPLRLALSSALENSVAYLCVGVADLNALFKGGVLVPDINPPGFFLPLPTGPFGVIDIVDTWPSGIPSGLFLYYQYWVQDAAGPVDFAASNAMRALTP